MILLIAADIAATLALVGVLWLWVALVPPRVVRVRRLHVRGAQGLSLPGWILIVDQAWGDERVLRHELEHVRQMRRYSPIGVAIMLGWHYLVGSAVCRVREGHWPGLARLWSENRLEQEAIAAMDRATELPSVRGWP